MWLLTVLFLSSLYVVLALSDSNFKYHWVGIITQDHYFSSFHEEWDIVSSLVRRLSHPQAPVVVCCT